MATLVAGLALAPAAVGQGGFPEVQGWAPEGEVGVYDAGNLWEYINGAAEQYLRYGFRELRHADLTAGGALVVTAQLYEMGSALEAFGIYTLERPPEGEPLPIGVEAVVSPPYQGLMVQGSTYVKIDAFEGELTAESGAAILRALSEALPGDKDLPAELGLLPASGRAPRSERLSPSSFLGLSELTHCLHADYQSEKWGAYQVFAVLPSRGRSSAQRWDELAEKWTAKEHKGRQILFRQVPYRGYVGIVRGERAHLGLVGIETEKELLKRLRELADHR